MSRYWESKHEFTKRLEDAYSIYYDRWEMFPDDHAFINIHMFSEEALVYILNECHTMDVDIETYMDKYFLSRLPRELITTLPDDY